MVYSLPRARQLKLHKHQRGKDLGQTGSASYSIIHNITFVYDKGRRVG